MRIRIKYIVMICLTVLCVMVAAGCGKSKDKNGSMLSDDGRSYGGRISAVMKEKVSTAFFDVTVDEAVKYNTFQFADGLYQAEAGKTYLVVKVTVENTYSENLAMSVTDFTLDYEGNEAEKVIVGYGRTETGDIGYLENLFTLKVGESVTGYILFTVADLEQYTLGYMEYYEDKFEGNTYAITLKPEIGQPAAVSGETEQPTEAAGEEQGAEQPTEAAGEEQGAEQPAETAGEEQGAEQPVETEGEEQPAAE